MKNRKSILFLFSVLSLFKLEAAIESIQSGSFIINMSAMPQTVANGLRPYGMVYDLVKNYKVPIKWIINSSKTKDGIDFSHNGIDYKAGPFIIPAEFRSAVVNARITYWQGQGVIGTSTVSTINAEVFTTFYFMPIWTLDAQNGSIAEGYLKNALIPSSAYNWLAPSLLNCCNDIFVMPHADPQWPTHGRLYTWNLDCDGAIWVNCHAGSALENLFNPLNKSEQMNFLAEKTGNAVGSGPYEENALLIWGKHLHGSPPYQYEYPNDPIMQFMGIIDAAIQNGSEQIYLPMKNWRPGTKLYVWDPSNINVPSKSPGPATIIISGRGFDDNQRGRVTYVASHSFSKISTPESVSAQRTFLNFSFLSSLDKSVKPELGLVPDTMYSGIDYNLSVTVPPGNDINSYNVLWEASCIGTFASNNNASTIFTPGPTAFPSPCIVKVTISDACGRQFSNAKVIIVGCRLEMTVNSNSPSCFGNSNGNLQFTLSNGTEPYNYNWSRLSPAGMGSGIGNSLVGLIAGTYNITMTDGGNCSKTTSIALGQPIELNITTTIGNVLCNGSSTGSIALNVTGGTLPYTFNWGGGISSQNRFNIPVGSYTVTVTDANGCTKSSSCIINEPSMLDITLQSLDIKCFGNNTGSILATVLGGVGNKNFSWDNGSSAQNLTGLYAGTYSLTVTDANGCTTTNSAIINQPSSGLILDTDIIDITCYGGNTGSIDLSVSGGSPTYSYSWSNGNTTEDVIGLSVGTYTVTVTDINYCTNKLSNVVKQAPLLELSVSITPSTCPTDTDGAVILTISGGTPPYSFDWSNDGYENPDDDTKDLLNVLPGFYTVIVTDVNNCTASTSANVNAINANPLTPIQIIKN